MTKEYYDDDLLIGMQFPDDWDTAENEQFKLILLAPAVSEFRANMTFLVRDLQPPTPENLKQLIAQARSQREADYDGFELVEELEFRVDEFPAHQEVYHWNADEVGTGLTQLFALIMTGPTALYSIHATCLRETESTYIPQFKAIIQSFEFYEEE